MPYASLQEVRDRTSFTEVSSLSDSKLTGFIERAESWIHRSTGRKFRDETDSDILSELRTSVVLLVEYLWYHDHSDVKEEALSPIESEKIGSYSYSGKKATPEDKTGITELDSIIDSLKVEPITGLAFFSISGPTGG